MKKLKEFFAVSFLLLMPIAAEGAANRVCNYTQGSTTVSEAFTNCTEEVAKLYERGVIPTTGAAGTDTYSATSAPAVVTLVDGMTAIVEIPNTNTGASTFNLDSTGAIAIKDPAGNAMAASDLIASTRYLLQYRSTGPQWRLMSPKGAGGTATGSAGGDLTGTYPNPTVAANAVALTTDTTGNYVGSVADGTGIDGTAAAEGATYTPTLDLTELNIAVLGDGSFSSLTFDAGAVDTIFNFATNSFIISGGGTAPVFGIDDQGELRLYEEDAGGTNYVSFAAPAAIGSNRTCVLVDGAAPIPDSCVGDGTDAGSAGGDDVTVNGGAATNPNLNGTTPAAAAGGGNVIWQISGADVSAYYSINGFTEDGTGDVDNDFFATYDASAVATKKMKPRTLLKMLGSLTEDTTPDTANDFVLSYDSSAGDVKKVKPTNLTTSVAKVPHVTVKTTGTTFTTNASTTTMLVECVGGGGGGGDSGSSQSGTGGGGGGYVKKLYTVASSTGYTYAIGAAGIHSGNGGASTFTDGVTLITGAAGIQGEDNKTAFDITETFVGGTGTNGDINVSGATGGNFVATTLGGRGGDSFLGRGGLGGQVTDGAAGTGYGAGGGGASNTANSGGAGAIGACIFTEYY